MSVEEKYGRVLDCVEEIDRLGGEEKLLAAVRDYGLAVHEAACHTCRALNAARREGVDVSQVCPDRARLAAMGLPAEAKGDDDA